MLQHTFYWVYAYRKSHRVYHNNQDSRIVSKYVLLKNKTIFVLSVIYSLFLKSFLQCANYAINVDNW